MTAAICMGHVVDVDSIEIEVWLEEGHVFLLYGWSQVGDFPLGHPDKCELTRVANRVALGEAKILAYTGSDDVIDENDRDYEQTSNRTRTPAHTVH